MRLGFILFLFLSISLYSCKKNAVKMNENFVGDWSTLDSNEQSLKILVIDENGRAYYAEGNFEYNEGRKRIARLENDQLYIGSKFSFTVNQEPMPIDSSECQVVQGNFELCIRYSGIMQLNNDLFYRVEEIF